MIKDLFHKNRPIYSLEVFPPKKDADVSVIYDALDQFKTLHPSFMLLFLPHRPICVIWPVFVERAMCIFLKKNSF